MLKKRSFYKKRQVHRYQAAAKACNNCQIKKMCTHSTTGRTLYRHIRQNELDRMYQQAESSASQKNIKSRQHLMERLFARSTRYGFKRARWRRLWRLQIQEYLTSAVQNMMALLKYIKEPSAALGQAVELSDRQKSKRSRFRRSSFIKIKIPKTEHYIYNMFGNIRASVITI